MKSKMRKGYVCICQSSVVFLLHQHSNNHLIEHIAAVNNIACLLLSNRKYLSCIFCSFSIIRMPPCWGTALTNLFQSNESSIESYAELKHINICCQPIVEDKQKPKETQSWIISLSNKLIQKALFDLGLQQKTLVQSTMQCDRIRNYGVGKQAPYNSATPKPMKFLAHVGRKCLHHY